MIDEQLRLCMAIETLDLPALAVEHVAGLLPACAGEMQSLAGIPPRVRGANDPVAAFAAALDFIHAAQTTAETLAGIAELFVAAADRAARASVGGRHALARAMLDTGAPPMRFGRYRVDPLDGSQRVEVVEPERLPARYWRHPEPEIDKAALRRDLLAGARIQGARLVTGPPTVRIMAEEARG